LIAWSNSFVDTADADAGEAFYSSNCFGCHGDPATDHQGANDGHPEGGILAYLGSDGKCSEFAHKSRWGIPDEIMTRSSIGSPTSADIANTMLYLQELGGTGFAMNAGLNGNWWNGLDRSGEGFQIEISSSAQAASSTEAAGSSKTQSSEDSGLTFAATFYSYNTMGDQIFLVAVGPVTGNTAVVDVFITDGGAWGQGLGESGAEMQFGTGIFIANGCDSIDMALNPNEDHEALGFTDLMYDLIPLTTRSMDCPSLGKTHDDDDDGHDH
jgi:hypothetical protein